jgi:hypothetical protein
MFEPEEIDQYELWIWRPTDDDGNHIRRSGYMDPVTCKYVKAAAHRTWHYWRWSRYLVETGLEEALKVAWKLHLPVWAFDSDMVNTRWTVQVIRRYDRVTLATYISHEDWETLCGQ